MKPRRMRPDPVHKVGKEWFIRVDAYTDRGPFPDEGKAREIYAAINGLRKVLA